MSITCSKYQYQLFKSSIVAIGIPDAQLLVSSGEEFPSGNSNDGSRGGAPAAIQLIQKMEPSGYLTLASNSTLVSTVVRIKLFCLDDNYVALQLF